MKTCFRLIGSAAALAFTVAAAAETTPTVKNVILVHGAFADGSGWMAVAKILERDGFKVSIAQPPETSLEDDVAATNRAIEAWEARSFWWDIVTAGSSSRRRAITRTLSLWFTSRPSSLTPAKA